MTSEVAHFQYINGLPATEWCRLIACSVQAFVNYMATVLYNAWCNESNGKKIEWGTTYNSSKRSCR